MDTSPTYRRVLRISAAVMAVVLMFQSGLIDKRTEQLFSNTTDYLSAAVGMSASVKSNELNTITAELTEQRQMLASREAEVTEREIAVNLAETGESAQSDRVTYLLAAILFVQLLLIILNYGLDYLRAREQRVLGGMRQTSG